MRSLLKSAVLLTLVGLLSGFAAVLQAAAEGGDLPVLVGSTSQCKNVVWIGAQGSGQTYADWRGLGKEVREGLDAYAEHMDGYLVGYFPVPYPSAGVGVLLTNGTRKTFFNSIDSGVQETLNFLTVRSARCPSEHYVLAGYSQGAMVMHRTLVELLNPKKKNADMARSVVRRLDGVLAIADGDRRPDQGGLRYGTASPDGWGVSWIRAALSYWSSSDYPPLAGPIPFTTAGPVPFAKGWPSSRFHSVCDAGDVVCDYGHLSLTDGIRIHSYDYGAGGDGAAFVRSAATNISNTTKELLLALQGGLLPDATVGSPYQLDLNPYLGHGTAPVTWSLVDPSAPGWTISSSGVVSSTPTSSGPVLLTIRAVDSTGLFAQEQYILSVEPADSAVTIDVSYDSATWVGQQHAISVFAYNSDYMIPSNPQPQITGIEFASGSLPGSTISITEYSGDIVWSPTAAGRYEFELRVTLASGSVRTVSGAVDVYPIPEPSPSS